MKVDFHYGSALVSLQIPEANTEQIIRPWQHEGKVDNVAFVRQALTASQADNFQDEVAGRRLCVLIDDGTRDEPFDDIFEPVFGVLQKSSAVQFLICTGMHDAHTAENNTITEQIEKAAKKAGIGNFRIHVQDYQQDTFLKAGRTPRGTEILFNVKADDAELFLVLSDVKVHYFAGYSNPIKNFVPGLCAFATAEQNHRLALDNNSTFGLHPWHSDQHRRTNPLADDQLEAMQLIIKARPVYALATISASGKIHWARFGPVDEVSRRAFDITDNKNTHTVKPVGRLIVSPGGLPNDVSLYKAQRALELAINAVADGGEILFLAACPNGIGEKQTIENFYNRLTAPVDEILKSIAGEYKLYSHKPYKFAQLILRLRRIWVYSQRPDDRIEAAHLHPAHHPQAVVDNWLAEDTDVRIIAVDGANKIALYAKQ